VRSLNLSNAVAIAVYEAWRQTRFAGAAASRDTPA
jgi:tRNA(Leu) C34 or U34 (ribose-2'-O)-methylase TrmL